MIKVLFMGRKPVAARCLEYLLSLPDVKVVGVLTDSHLSVSPTSDMARANDIPVLEFDAAIWAMHSGELAFDLGFSMLFWRKLKGPFLDLPARGVINFHPAPLPEYKGVGGYNLAILDGLSEWACTAHYVNEGIDTGEIVDVHRFPIDPDRETAKSLEATSQGVLFDQFRAVSQRAISSTERLETTANVGGRYLNRRELEELKRVDLDRDDVARKVRAFWFPPYDGAYIETNGQKFTLVDRSILESLANPSSSSLFTPKSGS